MSFHQNRTTTVWKKAATVSAAVFVTLCSLSDVQSQNTNFSGEWKLNEPKSTLGQYTRMTPRRILAQGSKDSMSVQRFLSQDGNEANYTEKLTFDGKESASTPSETTRKKSTAQWSDNGQTMTINSNLTFERDGQSFEVKIVEIWKLSDGGKVLTVASTSTSQMGTNTTKLVFDKAG